MTQHQQSLRADQILDLLGFGKDRLWGEAHVQVEAMTTPDSAEPKSLAFINQERLIERVERSAVSLVLAPLKLKPIIEKSASKKTWIFCENVELAARNLKNTWLLATPYRPSWVTGVHSTAQIHPSAELAPDVQVAAYAVIGAHVRIGKGTFVGAHSVVEENTEIGEDCTLHPQVYVGHSCRLGDRVEIKPHAVIGSEGFGYAHDQYGNHFRVPHSGRVILGDDVHVGAGTTIDRGSLDDTVIGSGTKIDNQCHFAHNTWIGKNGLITGQVVTAGSTRIGDNFICGGKTAITGHITIADNVNVAGLSGVSSSVEKPGAYGGYPLLPLKDHLRVKASSTHLPKLRKDVARILKHLFPQEKQSEE